MFRITVRGQSIECSGDICAGDSIDYLTCSFDFSAEWNGLSKTAQFTQNGKTYSVLLQEDSCPVPSEINDGDFAVSVFGILPGGTKRITTLCAQINMRKSGFVPDGESPLIPTADIYSQFVKKVEDAVQSIPEKLSDFENDADYATRAEIPTDVCQLANGADYATRAEIPTDVCQLANGADYATRAEIPTDVSQLANGADYATRAEIPTDVCQLANGADYATRAEIPTDVCQLANGADYATRAEIPAKVSDLPNDAGYITNENLTESNRASQIVKQSPEATVIKLDDSAELPFDKIDAPDGSTVSVYGKNLVPNVTVKSETSKRSGYRTESLPAGVYTISITFKNESGIAQYMTATGLYDSGNSFGNVIGITETAVKKNPATITLTESGKIFVYAGGTESFSSDQIVKVATIQIEAGTVATEYEEYKKVQTVTMPVDEMPNTHYPNTTVICNKGCSVKYKADATIAYKRTIPIEAAIVFETPKSKVIKLNDDVVQAPFVDIDAPDGSTVNIYGKNLVKNEIYKAVLSNGNSSFGYRTQSLPAGDYTISLSFKDDNDFPKYIYASAIYDNGESFGNALYITSQIINNNPLKITLATSGYIRVFDAAHRDEIGATGELSKITSIQIEAGSDATEYEEYKRVQTVTMPVDEMPATHYPNTTVVCNKNCSVKYVANGSKAYNKLLDRITALESAAVNNI